MRFWKADICAASGAPKLQSVIRNCTGYGPRLQSGPPAPNFLPWTGCLAAWMLDVANVSFHTGHDEE